MAEHQNRGHVGQDRGATAPGHVAGPSGSNMVQKKRSFPTWVLETSLKRACELTLPTLPVTTLKCKF